MSSSALVKPVSAGLSARAKHLLGGAAAALALGAFAPSAFAADECGVPVAGSVVCSAVNNPNATGISYSTVGDLNVSAPAGVVVNTTANSTNGITVVSTGATTLSGAATVTTSGDNSLGVGVGSNGGPVSVTTGAVSTSGIQSAGVLAISGNGAVTVNAGPVTVSGTGGPAIAALGTGPVNVTSNGASSVDEPAIYARSTLSSASVNLASGNVTSQSSDGIDITGTSAALTTASGTHVAGSLNGATLGSATGSTVTNAGTIGGGVYAISTTGGPATISNTGTINGALSLGGGADVVNNAGLYNAVGVSTFGAGDTFNNSGVVTVGTFSVVPTSATLGGLATFNNTGNINLINGRVGDTLTIAGNYVGSGGAQLGVDIAPGAAIQSDKLVIGGSASGSTKIVVALPAGSQPIFNNGMVIVQAGAGSSANAFVVAPGSVNAGLVRYDAVYSPVGHTYSVVASPSDAAYNMLTYTAAERNLWNKSADAVSAHMQSRRDALWSMGGAAPAGKFWLTMGGSVDNLHGAHDFGTLGQGHVTDTGYSQDYFGGQLGFDVSGGVGSRGGFAFGVTGGYNRSQVNLGGSADGITFDAVNGGAYASFSSGNLFINGLGKYDYYWADAQSPTGGFDTHLHGDAYGARGEIGLRLGNDALFFEPLAQVSYVHTSLDRFSVLGTSVDFDSRDGLRGKAGGRLGGVTTIGNGARLSLYSGLNYVHEFRGESRVTYTNAGGAYTVDGFRMPDYGEAVAGISIASNRAVSGFLEANYTHTLSDHAGGAARLEGVGGRAGITAKF